MIRTTLRIESLHQLIGHLMAFFLVPLFVGAFFCRFLFHQASSSGIVHLIHLLKKRNMDQMCIFLAQIKYFTNLDFPEIRGFPY